MPYIHVQKANCKNCYKCLKFCAVKSIRYRDGQVDVLEDQCVLCGRCINVCPQKAKTVVNDPAKVLSMLRDPARRVVASLAPSYAGVYGEDNRQRLPAALRRLGFDAVEETAAGAYEVSVRYKQLLDEGRQEMVLTTCCPTVNRLVALYYPSLLSSLAPVVSPVLAHGRQIKARDGADTAVVFIGPCLSKIREIDEHPESADAVLSFRMLDALLEKEGVRLEAQEPEPLSIASVAAPSRLYPVPEGIVRDVGRMDAAMKRAADGTYNGYRFLSVSGLENVMECLRELEQGTCGRVFVELNACEGGCVNGPLIAEEKRAAYRARMTVEAYAASPVAQPHVVQPLQTPPMEQTFTAEPPDHAVPDEATIRRILTEIGKSTPDKELNCGACGYPTCRDKAIAVYQKKAELYMCLPYIHDLAQSLSSVTLSVTPNLILAVDRSLRVIEINLAAQKQFGVSRQQALKSDVYQYMDPVDFEEVFATRTNIQEKKVRLEAQKMTTMQTLVYVPEQDIVVAFIQDITAEEEAHEKMHRARMESAEMAQKVIEKQMIVAQEIASLLGETTAETKVTLNNLKKMILEERDTPQT